MSTDSSYDVRLWKTRVRKSRNGSASYQVRWAVNGLEHSETFATEKLADSFRSELVTEARRGSAFDRETGLPEQRVRRMVPKVSWFEVAVSFVDTKWPTAAPRHRKSIAEALVTLAPTMTTGEAPASRLEVRVVLLNWSFNTVARTAEPTHDQARIHRWFLENSIPVAKAADPVQLRNTLNLASTRLDGQPAARATVARKRAVLYGVMQHAVELGELTSNPLDSLRWQAPRVNERIDRRVVVNPTQAAMLLAAVREIDPALEAFFGCMYFAALRPSEARHLRTRHIVLPDDGWGELTLTGSSQRLSEAWGGSDDQALKHRAATAVRQVPACPPLVRLLKHHIEAYGTGRDGRLFVVRVGQRRIPVAGAGRPISSESYARVWRRARRVALTPEEINSPLGRRPYDLRHAAVSTWLNAGVPATQVAEWAGHSVDVLLKVYAACLDGQDIESRRRVERALDGLSVR